MTVNSSFVSKLRTRRLGVTMGSFASCQAIRRRRAAIAALLLVLSIAADPQAAKAQSAGELSAFPGAGGFGKFAKGGRGGIVMHVTNLNDSGSGSLRACIIASGPRICVFDVGGTIRLTSHLVISNPYITIAGQTAPGGGILIRDATIQVRTQDVVIRYLRLRAGENVVTPTNSSSLSIASANARNIIADHMSISWHTDENVEIWDRSNNITIQSSIISEGLDCTGASSSEPCHSKGLLTGKTTTRYSILKSLFAHNVDRNGLLKDGDVEFINNVVYNYGPSAAATALVPNELAMRINLVGNSYIPGPNSHNGEPVRPPTGALYSNASTVYAKGNWHPAHRPSNSMPETDIFKSDPGATNVTVRHNFPGVPDESSANQAMTDVLDFAGASLPVRDAVDLRIVADVRSGNRGSIIDSEAEVGGFPTIAAGSRPASFDTDRDGIPDAWETMNGLNPTSSNDAVQLHANGYTNVENFLNDLAGDNVPGIGDAIVKPLPPANLQTSN